VKAKRYAVIWTAVALADVERLAAYLIDEAPLRADEIVERILGRAEALGRAPERGRVPPELRTLGDRSWREIQEPPWRIIFRISGSRVEIHGVLDGRRALEDLLQERLLRS
jgi:toxin ParE1/3/4